MATMDEIAAHIQRFVLTIGIRNFCILLGLLLFAFFFFFSRATGWHAVHEQYPDRHGYQGDWVGKDWDEVEVTFNNSTGVNSIRIGADSQGLYISMWIGFRPFNPPIFVPWSDVSSTWIKEIPFLPRPDLVKFNFAMVPDVPVYVGAYIAEEIEKLSEGQWKQPVRQ